MTRRTSAEWQALIEEQAQSGLTATEFCKQRGISDKYFSLRKQRFLKAAPTQEGFAVAHVTPKPSSIEVRMGQAVVQIPPSQPAAWIADFVKALV